MNHNTRLRAAGIPGVETLARRILRTFDRANASDIESGAIWYNDAQSLALELAASTGRTAEEVAAVISHLSPRTPWARNMAGAVTLLLYGERANGILSANYSRASKSLDHDGDPIETFGGPKTRRFYLNILGDTGAVTVDVWAARVVGVNDENALRRFGVYDAIEHAYRLAAGRRGVAPTTMQATTWIVARNGRAS